MLFDWFTIKNLKYKFISINKESGTTISGLSSFKNPKFLFFIEKLQHDNDILGWTITPKKINNDTYNIEFSLKTTDIKVLTKSLPDGQNDIYIPIPNNTRYVITCGFLISNTIASQEINGFSEIVYEENIKQRIDYNEISNIWRHPNWYGEFDYGTLMSSNVIEYYLVVDNYITNYYNDDIYDKNKLLNLHFYNFWWRGGDTLNLICYVGKQVKEKDIKDFKINILVLEGDN